MIDETKELLDKLRTAGCRLCIHMKIGRCAHIQQGKTRGTLYHQAADLIESLSAENERLNAAIAVTGAIECERDMIKHELEQVKRERDAAVKDLKEFSYYPCLTCKHRTGAHYCEKFGERTPGRDVNDVIFCGQYEWRGVKEG